MNTRMYWQDKTTIEEIIKKLKEEAVVAGSSDTVVGLIAPLTQNGFDALNKLKRRSDKPYLVLVASTEQANQFTDALQKEPIKTLIENCWPGPLTLIVPAKKFVPAVATSSSNTIALRVPDHAGLQNVANAMGGIFSTSANATNQPVPQTVDDIDQEIKDSVALLVDDQEQSKKNPSTILDCTGKTIKIVREGGYSREFLRQYLPTLQ